MNNGEYIPHASVKINCQEQGKTSHDVNNCGNMQYQVSNFHYKFPSSKPNEVYWAEAKDNNCSHSSTISEEKIHNGQNKKETLSKDRVKRDRKVLHPQAKELILNVVNFMKQEAGGEFVVPARKVQCRAAMATGFSERTVRRVVKESKTLPAAENSEGSTVSFPPKKVPNRPKPKTGLDSLTRCAVRKIIHRIYVCEKVVPTIKKIHEKLVEEIGFKGGSRSAHKIVKELGFYWKKTKAKSFVLMEKHDIRLKRIEYLRDMTRLRHEGRPIVYIGDAFVCSGRNGLDWLSCVVAGSERGFIPGSLYTAEGQVDLTAHLPRWTQEVLCPALPMGTVVIIDGPVVASYQDRIPAFDADAETMKQWLTAKGIPHRSDMLRPELHQVIRKNAGRLRKNKGVVEQILTSAGHTVLRTPPDHPDLNPAALIWAEVRQHFIDRAVLGGPCEFRAALERHLSEMTTEWTTRCEQVRTVEQQYLASEGIVDAEVERVLAANKDAVTKNSPEELEDPHDNNINFVRHFMGGLLGIDGQKVYVE